MVSNQKKFSIPDRETVGDLKATCWTIQQLQQERRMTEKGRPEQQVILEIPPIFYTRTPIRVPPPSPLHNNRDSSPAFNLCTLNRRTEDTSFIFLPLSWCVSLLRHSALRVRMDVKGAFHPMCLLLFSMSLIHLKGHLLRLMVIGILPRQTIISLRLV